MANEKDEFIKSVEEGEVGQFITWLTKNGYKIIFEAGGEVHVMRNYRDDQNKHVLGRYIKQLYNEQ